MNTELFIASDSEDSKQNNIALSLFTSTNYPEVSSIEYGNALSMVVIVLLSHSDLTVKRRIRFNRKEKKIIWIYF